MSEEKKPSTGGITKLLATFGTALIMFFAGIVWRAYEKTDEALREMSERLKALEEDKSKWGTLTELHNKTISLELEMARQRGLVEGFILAVHGGAIKAEPKALDPTTPKPVPVAPPKPVEPLKSPAELFKDAEEYRKFQQNKYPLPPNQQKK
jgi:hypothetical protein